MPAVDDLQFDTTGWELRAEAAENRHVWENAFGDVLTLRYNPSTPKIPSLFRPQALRNYYVQQVKAGGGCILSIELLHVKGTAISMLIFKTPQPAGGWGYMGSLALVYQGFSYSLRMQTVEIDGDEERGQRTWASMLEAHPEEADSLALWFGRAGIRELTAVYPCLADDKRWDAEFPCHPLSRLRSELRRIIPSLEVSRDVKNSQPHR